MAFLDNSGDIILDAVLTDTGRLRMAQGVFRISKFALGDEEIDYGLYDKTAETARADIDILSTPVMEACTDNAAGLKTKLVTMTAKNLLHLPVIKLAGENEGQDFKTNSTFNAFVVPVDDNTKTALATTEGLLYPGPAQIRLDQGIDNAEITKARALDEYLVETQYIIEINDRLGTVVSPSDEPVAASKSYIDDDQIASYLLTEQTPNGFVTRIPESTENNSISSPIAGSRGTKLIFSIRATTSLATDTQLFQQLGGTVTIPSGTYYFIDTNVRVMGASTGYRIDIPVRFLKLYS